MITKTNFLKHARNLIIKGWTQGHYAKNNQGDSTCYKSKEACKFCSAGALLRTDEDFGTDMELEVREILKTAINGDCIVDWNDKTGRTKKQVVEAFNKAIKKLSKTN